MHDQVWQATLPVLCLDAELRITVWNDAATQATGLSTDEASGQRLQDVVPLQSGMLAQLQTAEERSYVLDFPSQRTEKRLQLHLLVCRDDGLSGFVGFAAPDPFGEHWAEDKTFTFSEKVETSTIPCFRLNTKGDITGWNREMVALTHTDEKKVLGQAFLNFVEPSSRPSVSDVLSKVSGGSVETSLCTSRTCAGLDVILNVLPKFANTEGVLCIVNDVTALKASVAASACVAKEMRHIIDDSTQAILGIDAKGLVNEWNRAAVELFGLGRVEVFGKKLATLDVGAAEVAQALEVVSEGQPTMQEVVWNSRGKHHELRLHLQPREVGGAICLVEERVRRLEEGLPQEQVALGEVDSVEAVVGLDQARRVTHWNAAAAALLGYNEVEIVGTSLAALLVRKGDSEGLDLMLHAVGARNKSDVLLCDVRTKEGDVRRLCLNAMPCFSESDTERITILIQDVTKEKLLQLQAERAVKDMQMLIEEAVGPIWGTDQDGRVTVWNPKMVEVTGLPPEQALGQQVLSMDFLVQAEGVADAFEQVSNGDVRAWRRDVVLTARGKHLQAEVVLLLCGTTLETQILFVANIHAGHSPTVMPQPEAQDRAKPSHCVPFFAVNWHGEITEWDDKVSRLTGHEPKEVIGHPFQESFTRGHEAFQRAINLGMEGQEDLGYFEIGLRTKQDDEVTLVVSAGVFRHADGQVAGVLALGQDVTNMRKRLEELEASAAVEGDLRRLTERAGVLIFGIDHDGLLDNCNQEFVGALGMAKEEIIQSPFVSNFIPAAFKEDVTAVLQQALAGNQVTGFEFELAKHAPNQGGQRISGTATPRRDSNGQVTGVFCVGQDITRLYEVVAEQKGLAEDLARTFGAANVFMCGVSTDGLVIRWNQKAAELSGFCQEEAVGKALKEFVREDLKEELSSALSKALKGKETANVELVLLSKDVREIELVLNITPLTNPRGDVAGAVCVGQAIAKPAQPAQQVEEELTLMDAANAAIFSIDMEGRVSEWNQKVATLTGFDKEEALGRNLVPTFIAESHQGEAQAVFEKALEGQPFENHEVPVCVKGGGCRYILLNAAKWTSSIHGLICVGQDITEHRSLLMQHQLVAEDLRTLTEIASTPIFGVDAKGCITVWNRKAEEITSYTKNEVEGRPFVQGFILESQRQKMQKILDGALQGKEMLNIDLVLCSKSGEERNLVLNSTPRRDRDGKVIGLICIGQDITEVIKQKQEAELLAAELKSIIHSASAPIIELDRHSCITEWNERVAEITGIPRDQVIGKELLSFVLDSCAAEVARVLKEAIEDGIPKADLEVMVESRHQDSVVLLLSCTPRMGRDDVILGAICIGQDITHMKELDVKRSAIAATVTHELRSPLHGIIGLSEQMISAGDERQKRPLIMISHCARRLLDLVTNIMDLSTMVESKRMLLARDPVHMSKLIEEVLLLVSTAVDKAKRPIKKETVQLINSVPDQLPIIEADANRCLQMLYNIVTNAFKYTKEGSVEVSASADDEREVLTVQVRDTGIGISPASCERIFLPFEQEDQQDNRRYEGLGLGLAISREVAVKHGGNLTVESQVGEGSTFSITLPYRRHVRQHPGSVVIEDEEVKMGEELEEETSVGRCAAAEAQEDKQRRAKDLLANLEGTIWVVDDDREARRKVKEILKTYSKASVIECESSYSCMSWMEGGQTPRMILLDTEASQSMQGGCHLLRWIRMRCSFLRLPIVVISSDVSVTAMLEAVQAGCNEWIAKPFKAEELVARMSLALAAVWEQAESERHLSDGSETLAKRRDSLVAGRATLRTRLELVEGYRQLSSSSMPPMPTYDQSEDDELESSLSASDAEDEKSPNRSDKQFSTFEVKRAVTPDTPKKTITIDVPKHSSNEKGTMKPKPKRPSFERMTSKEIEIENEPKEEPQQVYQRYSLECYRLLGRLLPRRAAECLIKDEVVQPEKFHGAVMVANLQGLDALAIADHKALGNFFDGLHSLSTSENINLLVSADHLVAVSGYDSPPGHEIHLARFALALEEQLQALRRTILPGGEQKVTVCASCGIHVGEIWQLVLGHLHPQVWIAGSATSTARRLCKNASQHEVPRVLVSSNLLLKIRSALPSLSVSAVDVTTGTFAPLSLQEALQLEGKTGAADRCYALLRPNEVLQKFVPPETMLPAVPPKSLPLSEARGLKAPEPPATGGAAPSVSSRSPRGASTTSRASQAQLQAQHLLLDNRQLRQRCEALEMRSQELQRSYWQVQQLADEAQAQARQSQWEMNFWRLQLGER